MKAAKSAIWTKKIKQGLHKVVEVMQGFDKGWKVPEKVLVFWDKFKNRYRNADFEQYKVQSSRHDNICMPTAKMCKKIMKLMICICSRFLCWKLFDNKPCKSTLRTC